MKKMLFVALAVLAALTEVLLTKGFKVEDYKSATKESRIARDGSSTCFSHG
ncbi:hypothetical protein WDW86_14690 [Bdellovibrionota bacterium FG-2]